MNFEAIDVQTIDAGWLAEKKLSLNVLRLDKLHEVVSGNKWFKLKYYLQQAKETSHTTIATFGGAWSNHIVATAFATREAGLKSVGIIRGEKPPTLSVTLQKALEYGMKLFFVERHSYRDKQTVIKNLSDENHFWISEGGYGITGAQGAADILKTINTTDYTHIIAAVGTGTTLAGLLLAADKNQKVIGISSMKGNTALGEQVQKLLPADFKGDYKIFHDYHFGGYAKHPPELISFINSVYKEYYLPLDIVYTGKTFFAIKVLVEKYFFEEGSKILMIHSGGLQGNTSLCSQVLAF